MMTDSDKHDLTQLLKNILCFLIIPFILLAGGYLIYDHFRPLRMLVKVKELHKNPLVPFQAGQLTFSYNDTTITRTIRKGIYIEDINYHFKKQPARMTLESPGYFPLDTQIIMDKEVKLFVQRDARLKHLNGEIVDKKGKPMDSVLVKIKSNSTYTDSLGRFSIDIDSAKQQYNQDVWMSKPGFISKKKEAQLMKGNADEMRFHSVLFPEKEEKK